MDDVSVTELIMDGTGLLVMAKEAPSKVLGNIPVNYIGVKMRYEKGRYFLVEWRDPSERFSYYQIPQGLDIGGYKVDMSHRYTVYSGSLGVIGSFEDISPEPGHNLILVRIYPPPY